VKPVLEGSFVDSSKLACVTPGVTPSAEGTLAEHGLVVRAPRDQTDAEKLLAAAKMGDTAAAEDILASVDPESAEKMANCRGMWGNTPLIVATKYGSSELALRLLANWRADPKLINDNGAAALLFACMEGNETVARSCLEHGAIVDPLPASEYNGTSDEQLRLTPLHAASINGSAGIAAALLEAGANIQRTVSIDPKQQQDGAEAGDTPLGCSIAYAQAPVVQLLLDHGAKFTGGDPAQKKTPPARLIAACSKRSGTLAADSAVSAILKMYPEPERSADVAALDNKGATALHAACKGKLVLATEELIRCGADVNIADEKGRTPLLAACQQNGPEAVKIVKLLLAAGANKTATDIHGRTAISLARKTRDSSPLLQLLESTYAPE
jgi:ankyrin repeat protein